MGIENDIAFIIYFVLGVIGAYGIVLAYSITIKIIKNKSTLKSAFFLNREIILKGMKILKIIAILTFLTTFFAFLKVLFRYIVPISSSIDMLFFNIGFLFPPIVEILFVYVLYKWNEMVNKYVSKI